MFGDFEAAAVTQLAQRYRNRDVEYPLDSGFDYPVGLQGIRDWDQGGNEIGYPIRSTFTYPMVIEREGAVGGLGADDYFGPPLPGESWSSYQQIMEEPIYAAMGGAAIGALLGGPAGAILGALTSWAVAGGANKPGTTHGSAF